MGRPVTEDLIRSVYAETIDLLYGYVSRRCGGDRVLAEDVTQETWLRAVSEWRRKGLPDRPAAWLTTVARNLLLNEFRRAVPLPLEAVSAEDVLAAADDGAASESAALAAVVNHALGRLPSRQRDLLEAFHYERQSVAQIATSFRLSGRAVEGISAPRVGERDFVSERLRATAAAAQARLALTRDSVAELERRVRIGLASELPLAEAKAALARAEGQLRLLGTRLEVRREFLEQDLTAADAERRLELLELQLERETITAQHALAQERLAHLRRLHALGQVQDIDLKRAELDVLERAEELRSATQRLELLRAGGRLR